MRTPILIFLIVFCFCKSNCQVNLESVEDVIEYFEGDWNLYVRSGGFIATDTFPQENLEFKYNFKYQNANNIKVDLFRNDTLLNTKVTEVKISSFSDRYVLEVPEYPIVNPFNESVHTDVFCIRKEVEKDTVTLDRCIPDVPAHVLTRENILNTTNKSPNEELVLFPNPASDIVYFSKSLPIESLVTIYNSTGVIVSEKILQRNQNSFNVSFLSTGCYTVLIKNNELQIATVIIKE